MPRKPKDGKPFDQTEYIKNWTKENMKQVKVSYKAEFVEQFRESCKKLGVSQSDVFRKAMQEIIQRANEIESK